MKSKFTEKLHELTSRELPEPPSFTPVEDFEDSLSGENTAGEAEPQYERSEAEDAAIKWTEDAQELFEIIFGKRVSLDTGDENTPDSAEVTPGLFTAEEKDEILKRLKEIPPVELAAVADIIGEKAKGAGPVLASLFSGIDAESVRLLFDGKEEELAHKILASTGEIARVEVGKTAPEDVSTFLLLLAGIKEGDIKAFESGPPVVPYPPSPPDSAPESDFRKYEAAVAATDKINSDREEQHYFSVIESVLGTSREEAEKVIDKLSPDQVPILIDLLGNLPPDSAEKVIRGIEAFFIMKDSSEEEISPQTKIALKDLLGVIDNACDIATSNPGVAEKLQKALKFMAKDPIIQKNLNKLGYVLKRIDKSNNSDGGESEAPKPTSPLLPKEITDILLPFLDRTDVQWGLGKAGLDVDVIKKLLTGQAGPVLPKEITDKLLPFLDKLGVKSALKSIGLDADVIKKLLIGQSTETSPAAVTPAAQTSNKLIPAVVGLAGAVVGLSGFIMSEQKVRNFFSGLGTLGLVGAITALVKRNGVDADKRQVGWQDGWGGWIVGAGSALIGAIPFFSSENKKSASASAIGFGVVGAVLAYCFEPVRVALGLPASLKTAEAPVQPEPQK